MRLRRNYKSFLEQIYFVVCCTVILFLSEAGAQQINIARIDLMPNSPSPYIMRDWKTIAKGYDSLVYNFNMPGDFLPLIFFNNSTINYPDEQSFGLHTYVGTNSPGNGEAINVLPSIVGASLVGIDKRNQHGYDWVKMSREYFNKRLEMNVYKNSPNDNTYDDWWYESMPNIFFYQLYSLYPDVVDYDFQFRSVADRFFEVAQLSGGSTTPWNESNFSYRGWDFVNKQPYKFDVEEPEAAGAIGWILYNAYIETGEKKYLIGAEWCIEYLNSLTTNPAYEIQLPYGVYIAARMNAEIGTNYDIGKMFSWCFSFTNLRKWNVLLGRWGVYDINGLIGEDFDRQYAFAMNTFQQIGALVPLVRYDERFANAIGKWVLNAANSLRLFYSKNLDDFHQDSEGWSHQYDHNSYIAYEALLKSGTGFPFATGDAKSGGWAETNLSLYTSSSVGYLAGLLDTTNIPMILKLDLNKTDFFQKNSYQTFLLFNPFDNDTTVQLAVPEGTYNIYETISNSFIANGVTGTAAVSIPANSAVVIVLTPSAGNAEYVLDKLIIDGKVVDYNSGRVVTNYPPRIKSLSAVSNILVQNGTTKIYCTAVDNDNDMLKYFWRSNKGQILGEDDVIDFKPESDTGTATIEVIVEDSKGEKDSAFVDVKVVEFINHSPQINFLKAKPGKINIGEPTKIFCSAVDADNDNLTFLWQTEFGTITHVLADTIVWQAPLQEGDYVVRIIVKDIYDAEVSDSIKIMVRDFSKYTIGNLAAFYPFNGNVNDESGNGNNGTITGAVFTNDRFNKSPSALHFDGIDDKIQVSNSSSLNFQNAITISFWMKLDQIPNEEVYIISHGSWNKRYKVSITNRKLRWTIKTDKAGNGILDLDSESILDANKLYHCAVTYNGVDAEIWLNGELDSFASWSGKLLTSDVDLTIAQMLPTDANYNFKGVLDDFRIYDYMLSPGAIQELDDINTSVEEREDEIPVGFSLEQNYPNPFNPETAISYTLQVSGYTTLKVYDVLGREIATLVNKQQLPGKYSVQFNVVQITNLHYNLSSGIYFYRLHTGQYSAVRKMILLK